jgi:hypothetical protein
MQRLDRQISSVRITPQPLALIVGVGAVICLALLVAARARSDQWPYRIAPAAFSFKMEMTSYDRNSAGDLWEVETQAQRSDGATVTVATLYFPPRVRPRTIRVIKLPDGTWVRLVDAVSAKSTCRPKRREVAPARETSSYGRRPPDCLGPLDKLLGQTVLFGQKVDIVKTWDHGSAGQEWLAPGLGCKELQWQNADLQLDGSRRISLEGKLASFTLGEPDPRLFNLGTTYTEVKPSDLLRREMKVAGLPWSPELDKAGEREDHEYATACSGR